MPRWTDELTNVERLVDAGDALAEVASSYKLDHPDDPLAAAISEWYKASENINA